METESSGVSHRVGRRVRVRRRPPAAMENAAGEDPERGAGRTTCMYDASMAPNQRKR